MQTRLKFLTDQYGSWNDYAKIFGLSLSTFKRLVKEEIIPRPPIDSDGKMVKKDNAYIKEVLSTITIKKCVGGRIRVVPIKGPKIVSMTFYARLVNVSVGTMHNWLNTINPATGKPLIHPLPRNEKGRVVFDEGYVTYLMSIVAPRKPAKAKKEKRVDTARLQTVEAEQYQQALDEIDEKAIEEAQIPHKKGSKVFYGGSLRKEQKT